MKANVVKTMVRGLKEDNSLLPVAFMDMNMYVSVAKSLDSMILFGDFMKGISFVGFSVSIRLSLLQYKR